MLHMKYKLTKEQLEAFRKAELDKMTFGSVVVHVSNDGTVKHILLKDFIITEGDKGDN